ncbi:flagellar export protein FliJ [Glaciimonas soli]|uniref:Flagellar FliJ protein n=1 Tax=Glaciimonas soli TaxID=2590999 RepID=A0A843YN85_9BURK|nr:flagellar export protein FliJ [Glaciimonas soli]MQQ99446.1 flagellar export protein FliJ [Glaciimonas soli]
MTKNTLPLPMLIELAEKKTDNATRRLGQLQTALSHAKEKVVMLHAYRTEYYLKLHAQMEQGAPSSYWRNTQHFITTLDGAIVQQESIVRQAEESLIHGRKDWIQAKQKVSSFCTLEERVKQQEAQVQSKREQGISDEHAARQFSLREVAI